MTTFLYGGLALVSLIVLLLIVLRLRSERSRLIAVAVYAFALMTVVSVAVIVSRDQADPERDHGREIDRAVADLGERYVLFRSLGPPDSTLFDETQCRRGTGQDDYGFVQRTWLLSQPVDVPTLEAALARDGFTTSPISNSGAAAYGFMANRNDLAIQVQAVDTGTEVRFYHGPCVPRPTIELAAAGRPLATGGLYLP
jgi:hypothetical protein